jgi:hypothetical protein
MIVFIPVTWCCLIANVPPDVTTMTHILWPEPLASTEYSPHVPILVKDDAVDDELTGMPVLRSCREDD